MTDSIEISPRLEEWAALADYMLTPASRTHDGRALFWSAGGETRLYIGTNRHGWLIITDSFRMGSEKFKFAALSRTTIERYFFGRFGEYIRSMRNLPRVHIPGAKEEISAGFRIETTLFEGVERFALTDSDGSLVAIISGGALMATVELVSLSLYLSATIDDITASFLDPDGGPLFALS
jgi:hypothetical protein